jgi:plastocyanin
MQERDGKMLFAPDRVEIRKGEQIKFVLHNSGELDHEFVLATAQENSEHAAMMKENPEMRHADSNARRVAPKQTTELVWKFTKVGEFEFACLIPGHRDAGMFGAVDVKQSERGNKKERGKTMLRCYRFRLTRFRADGLGDQNRSRVAKAARNSRDSGQWN